MHKNWKRMAALGLTVLLGCMMPAGTMLAAADDAQNGAATVTDNDALYEEETAPEKENVPDGGSVSDEENMPDDGSAPDEENVPDGDGNVPDGENVPDGDGNVPDEENVPDDGNVPDGENVPDGDGNVSDEENVPDDEAAPDDAETDVPDGDCQEDVNADQIQEAGVLSAADAEVMEAEPSQDADAPEITITSGGADITCPLGGEITFKYVNNWAPMFEISVSQIDADASVYCYRDKVADMKAGAKTEDVMDSLYWGEKQSPPISLEPLSDGCYVVYVKVETGGETYYARSEGVVVDTKKPVIKDAATGQALVSGQTYPEDTRFMVEEANLKRVLVNGQEVNPEDGSYKVAAKENSTSCEIKAIDEAGNEETCSITLSGSGAPGGDEEPPVTDHVISKSGVYDLKAGEKYHLAEGKWKVKGDKSVYPGGRDFYVMTDGSYEFTK